MTNHLDATAEFRAAILAGRALAEGGDFDAAEAHFIHLLHEARDAHVGNHALALGSLITLYGRAGRYLEAHLLARRLVELAQAAGGHNSRSLAFAQGKICGVLGKLHLVEPLEHALQDLRATLDRIPETLVNLELEYHAASATRASRVQDLALARVHLTAYRTMFEQAVGLDPVYAWALEMSEIRLTLGEGHPEVAKQQLQRFQAGGVTPDFHRFEVLSLGVAIHAALGQREDMRRIAGEVIALLESVQDDPFLASDRIHQGTRLTPELEKLEELDLAQRVYDLVAAAVMIRLRQVDDCMQRLPELGLTDAESTAMLSRFRKQFLSEQHALLQRVGHIFQSRGDEYVRSLLANPGSPGLIAICAWCECVRPSEGRWLPIGHFIPRDAELEVTHGICPTCAERWYANSA